VQALSEIHSRSREIPVAASAAGRKAGSPARAALAGGAGGRPALGRWNLATQRVSNSRIGRAARLVRDCRSRRREDRPRACFCRDLSVRCAEFSVSAREREPQRDPCPAAEEQQRKRDVQPEPHPMMALPGGRLRRAPDAGRSICTERSSRRLIPRCAVSHSRPLTASFLEGSRARPAGQ
jgi:hypothetical protein